MYLALGIDVKKGYLYLHDLIFATFLLKLMPALVWTRT